MKKALFAGSFNPPTLGHLDIIQRAAILFEKVYVGIAENTTKPSKFTLADKTDMLILMTKHLDNVEIVSFHGLVADFAKQQGIDVLIRALRTSLDWDWEMSMANANKLLSGLETLFIVADPKLAHICSSLVREIAFYGGSLKGFVPHELEKIIQSKLQGKQN